MYNCVPRLFSRAVLEQKCICAASSFPEAKLGVTKVVFSFGSSSLFHDLGIQFFYVAIE